MFEQFSIDSSDLKPTSPVKDFGDAVSSALKSTKITDINFTSGVGSDFSSDEFKETIIGHRIAELDKQKDKVDRIVV